MAKKTLTLVGTGGTGSKFVERLMNRKTTEGDGFANISVKILDSAKSDRKLEHTAYTEDNTWTFKNMDGSGAYRAENAEAFMGELPTMMRWIGDTDAYVIVTSGSGGTGSVLSVLIMQELLKQNKQVITIVIGSHEDKLACVNTRNTLFSFQNLTDACGLPPIVHYLSNGADGEQLTDELTTRALLLFSVLFSGENERLDTKDLANWLSFKTTTCTPKLCRLDIHTGKITQSRETEYVSIATLARHGGPRDIGVMPEFSRTGFVPESFTVAESDIVPFPVSFCIADGGFQDIIEELNAVIIEFDKNKVARQDRSISVSTDTAVVAKKGALVL